MTDATAAGSNNKTTTTAADDMKGSIQAAAAAHRIVVFSGAGMSADSGIGTFRGQGGAWSGLWGKLALLWGGTPIGWKWTPGYVWKRYVLEFNTPIKQAQPHAGYQALEQWRQQGNYKSFTYITMNVDGLHQTSGASQAQVAEVHGSVLRYRCMMCQKKIVLTGDLDPYKQPRCEECQGRVRPDVTLFTESLPIDEWGKACRFIEELRAGDVLVVAGTSSVVYPAASLPEHASAKGITVIEFNYEFPTPLSSIASFTIVGRAAETLPRFTKGVLEELASKRKGNES